MGRKPKRRVFASEGLRLLELDAGGGGSGAPDMLRKCFLVVGWTHILTYRSSFCSPWIYASFHAYMRTTGYGIRCIVPPWASYGELHEVEQRLARVKADLISELVAVRVFLFLLLFLFSLPVNV